MTSNHDRELANAVLSDLERKVCSECDGTGTVCWCCMSAVRDCECGPEAEPAPCDVCEGTGAVAIEDAESPAK